MEDELNLSPIHSENHNDNSLDFEDVGLDYPNFENAQFRNDLREFIQTQKQTFKEAEWSDDEVMKGSFLKEMERLGKSLSFQSSTYNIYEGNSFESERHFRLQEQYPNGNPFLKKLPSQYVIDFKVKLIKNKSSKKGFVSLNKENSKKKKETNLTLKKDSSKISVSGNKLEKKSIRNSTCRWSSIQTPQFIKRVSNNSSANLSNLSSNLNKGKKIKTKEVRKKLQERIRNKK